MDSAPKTSFGAPIAATLFGVLIAVGGYGLMHHNIACLGFIAKVPHATLAAPRVGAPAIYSGTVHGPSGRATPTGKAAAAVWFSVDRVKGKSRKTVCALRQHDAMVLRDGDRSLRLALFEGNVGVQLMSDDASEGHGELTLDLGATPSLVTNGPAPPGVTGCDTGDPEYSEHHLPEGARVDVLACYRDGALHACDAPEQGALAVGGIANYQRHGVGATLGNALVVLGFGLFFMQFIIAFGFGAATTVFQGRLARWGAR